MARSQIASFAVVVILAGCGGPVDDCVAPPFTSPSIAGGLQGTASAPFIVVEWDASNADLPDAYFEKVRVDPANVATGISYTSPRQLKIQLVALAQLPVGQTVDVSVALPDTRDFTLCRHPGEADVYSFSVGLQFDNSHALTRADIGPIVRSPGAI
jgi:hypothetical protein